MGLVHHQLLLEVVIQRLMRISDRCVTPGVRSKRQKAEVVAQNEARLCLIVHCVFILNDMVASYIKIGLVVGGLGGRHSVIGNFAELHTTRWGARVIHSHTIRRVLRMSAIRLG